MGEVNCCICGKKINAQYGNNPDPITKNGTCCDECNATFVIPARMGQEFNLERNLGAKGVAIYTIDKLKELFKNNKIETGIYTSVNEDGCDVIVVVKQGEGFAIKTNQQNGWVRVDSYDYDKENDRFTIGEGYEGKWK